MNLVLQQYLMDQPPREQNIADFYAKIEDKLVAHYKRTKQYFDQLLHSTHLHLIYKEAAEQALSAINHHLEDKRSRLRSILNPEIEKAGIYYAYNAADYMKILGQDFQCFTQLRGHANHAPQSMNAAFLEELLQCEFEGAQQKFKQILLEGEAQKYHLMLAQLLPILRLSKVPQPPRPLFCWEWVRCHLSNFLQDDIFYLLLRSCNDEQREQIFIKYDDHPQIGKNRVLYEAYLKTEAIVMNWELLTAVDDVRIAHLDKVLELFRERRLIDRKLQGANRNEFRQHPIVREKGLMHLIVALIQKYCIQTLPERKSNYRRILDRVQNYQSSYKRHPRAILFFKDMEVLEWTENRYGDLSYIDLALREDMKPFIGIRIVDSLLAPTDLFRNQNAELHQQLDQQCDSNKSQLTKHDDYAAKAVKAQHKQNENCRKQLEESKYQLKPKPEDEQKGRITELRKFERLFTSYIAIITFTWYDSKGNLTNQVQGTGFLFSQRLVITAKHNFYRKTGERIICQYCRVKFRISDTELVTYESKDSSQWFESPDWDLGAIALSKGVEHFSNQIDFLSRAESQRMKRGEKLLISGYSLQYRKQRLEDSIKHLQIEFSGFDGQFCEYKGDTVNGLSGSPVFYKYLQGRFYVAAIHISRKSPTNHCRGILLSERMINQIVIWKELAQNQAINLGVQMSKHKQFINKLLNELRNENDRFQEVVYENKKQANFQNLMEAYRMRIINHTKNQTSDANRETIFREISAVILRIGSPHDLQKLFVDVYRKNSVKNGLYELLRLRIVKQNCIQQIQQRLNKQSAEADGAIEDEYEDVDEESEESIDEQLKRQVIQFNNIPQSRTFRKIIEMKRSNWKALSTQEYSNHLAIISYIQKGSSLLHIPQHKILQMQSHYCLVQIQKGFDYTVWQKTVEQNEHLMAYLWLRDVCSITLELESLNLYYFNFELRHMLLYDKELQSSNNPLPLLSDEKVRRGSLQFKIIDYSQSLCLGDQKTISNLEKLAEIIKNKKNNAHSKSQSQITSNNKSEPSFGASEYQLLKKISIAEPDRQRQLRYEQRIRCKQFIKSSIQRLFDRENKGASQSANAVGILQKEFKDIAEKGTIEEIKEEMDRKIKMSKYNRKN